MGTPAGQKCEYADVCSIIDTGQFALAGLSLSKGAIGTRAGVDFCVFDMPHRCNECLSSACVFAIARSGAAETP